MDFPSVSFRPPRCKGRVAPSSVFIIHVHFYCRIRIASVCRHPRETSMESDLQEERTIARARVPRIPGWLPTPPSSRTQVTSSILETKPFPQGRTGVPVIEPSLSSSSGRGRPSCGHWTRFGQRTRWTHWWTLRARWEIRLSFGSHSASPGPPSTGHGGAP
jgi:hypothetical protein